MFDLRSEPLLTLEHDGAHVNANLAETLALLADPAAHVTFRAVQPVQRHPWHAFLVQLGALCIARAGVEADCRDPQRWSSALLQLADGVAEAWHLVVEDPSRPAFLQSPAPENSFASYGDPSPIGSLDLIVSTRGHDVKVRRMAAPTPEHWALALVTLQTMQGFSGRANYGIARMNGGLGNRPGVSFITGWDSGSRWRADVAATVATRGERIRDLGFGATGSPLIWVSPWGGDAGATLSELDPDFIEICRRVRLVVDAGQLSVRHKSTLAARVSAPDDIKGIVGDTWTPIEHGTEPKAMTLSGQGFDRKRTWQLLTGTDFESPPAQRLDHLPRGPVALNLWALVRGQGKTEGLHQRIEHLPPKARLRLTQPEGRASLGVLGKAMLEASTRCWSKTLWGPLERLGDVARERGRDHFEAAVDTRFFGALFEAAESAAAEPLEAWLATLRALALETLQVALDACAAPAARRHEACARAELAVRGALNKHFPQPESQAPSTHEEAVHAP